ncbi:C4-dicarboxylate ABC transporter [Spirochaetia bacterium]|nr:C4-dicarboxylate ABC transporter [Spirochaetia bacterium]
MVTFFMYLISALSVGLIVFMLIRKMDIKITMIAAGLLLIIAAIALGQVEIKKPVDILVPFAVIVEQFKISLPGAGLIILMLGGYAAYMSAIGANEVTVNSLTKPLKGIKSPYIMVPFVFLIGSLLSMVIPSASILAIILLSTLYPLLKKSGMGTLTAAGVIATTATVMPTPLGSDNVAVAQELGISAADYVFRYHAVVSVPTLLFMAVVHYFWQKHCDRKDQRLAAANPEAAVREESVELAETKKIEGGPLFRIVYTILPLFPVILLLGVFIGNFVLPREAQISLSVELATLLSLTIAIFCELIRHKNGKKVLDDTGHFFKGMGNALDIVILLIAAGVFVAGLTKIGVIAHLQSTMQHAEAPGFILPLILVILSALIVLLSGSGTSLFFAMVPLMVPLAGAAGISVLAVSVPMGLAGNLLRAVSPVSAVVIIVAGSTKMSPMNIVRRTSAPMIAGTILMFVLSMVLFLPGILSL